MRKLLLSVFLLTSAAHADDFFAHSKPPTTQLKYPELIPIGIGASAFGSGMLAGGGMMFFGESMACNLGVMTTPENPCRTDTTPGLALVVSGGLLFLAAIPLILSGSLLREPIPKSRISLGVGSLTITFE